MISIEFLRAGKAIFTVSNASGKHYTFRISQKAATRTSPEVFFVGLLTGPDNTSDYQCIGRLMPDNTFAISQGYKHVPGDKTPAAVIEWALKMIVAQKELPVGYSIQHAGHCCRCARVLTEPQSLLTGIGPECRKKMGLAA